MVNEKKILDLKRKMQELCIEEKDIEEKFILGSGKGGQKLQKTSSCVYLKHIPTGIEVKCQQSRSQELNRFLAKRELIEKIETAISGKKSPKTQKQEKIRKQKVKRKKRSKTKIVKKFQLLPFDDEEEDDDDE